MLASCESPDPARKRMERSPVPGGPLRAIAWACVCNRAIDCAAQALQKRNGLLGLRRIERARHAIDDRRLARQHAREPGWLLARAGRALDCFLILVFLSC